MATIKVTVTPLTDQRISPVPSSSPTKRAGQTAVVKHRQPQLKKGRKAAVKQGRRRPRAHRRERSRTRPRQSTSCRPASSALANAAGTTPPAAVALQLEVQLRLSQLFSTAAHSAPAYTSSNAAAADAADRRHCHRPCHRRLGLLLLRRRRATFGISRLAVAATATAAAFAATAAATVTTPRPPLLPQHLPQ